MAVKTPKSQESTAVNEEIARWLGWEEPEIDPAHCMPGDPAACWHTPDGRSFRHLPFDADLVFWHGKDGLLTEIRKQKLIADFITYLQSELDPVCTDWGGVYAQWLLVGASPAELAGALAKAIKEHSQKKGGVD